MNVADVVDLLDRLDEVEEALDKALKLKRRMEWVIGIEFAIIFWLVMTR